MGGITRLLLLLWAGVTVSTVVDLQKRIVGGRTCGQNERPYHVRLIAVKGKMGLNCGGSLINNQWILTAAHCQEPGRTMYATLGVHPGPGQTVQITAAPVTYTDNNGVSHDIMLLKLPNPTQIQPIPLPDCNNRPRVGDAVQIAGYGATTAGPYNVRVPGRANTLQCADTTVVDCKGYMKCVEKRDPQFHKSRRYQHLICCQEKGVDISPGDSGGGVVYNGMIYGVISFGNKKHACVDPAGMMDVCEYKDWIRRKTGSIFTKARKALGRW